MLKLNRILNLTTSENDNEALSAIRAANRMLKNEARQWGDVLAAPHIAEREIVVGSPPYGCSEWVKEMMKRQQEAVSRQGEAQQQSQSQAQAQHSAQAQTQKP